jgi:hypothetical protein
MFGFDPNGFETWLDQERAAAAEANAPADLSAAEQLVVDKYINNSFGDESAPQFDEDGHLISGGMGSWWAIEYATNPDGSYVTDENGNAVLAKKQRAKWGDWTIEQDGENAGWTDQMIQYVSDAYRDASSNVDLPEAQYGEQAVKTTARPPLGGGSGSGGRGGSRGPSYVAPMREVVEDTVKAMLTALTGSESDDLIQEYTDAYLAAHRGQFDVRMSGGEDIDPNQVVLEKIRGQEDYKSIHALRSEGDSETRWISDRQGRLSQLGVASTDADDQALWLAQTGTNLNDIETGQLQTSKGRKDVTLFNKLGNAAQQVVGSL